MLNPVPPMTAQSLIFGPFELLPAAGAEARFEAALAREQEAVAWELRTATTRPTTTASRRRASRRNVAKREAAARRLVAKFARVTGNRPTQHQGLHPIARALKISWDEALAAVEDAEAKGWLTIEAGHSVCLTDEERAAALEKAARHPAGRHRL